MPTVLKGDDMFMYNSVEMKMSGDVVNIEPIQEKRTRRDRGQSSIWTA